jgi:hypothetical protein
MRSTVNCTTSFCVLDYNCGMIRYDRHLSKLFGKHVFIEIPDPRTVQEVSDEPVIVASLDLFDLFGDESEDESWQ